MLAARTSRSWRALGAGLLAGLFLGYGAISLAAWRCEACVSHFIFEPDRRLYAKASDFPFEILDIEVGEALHGWWVPGSARQEKVLLYLHGTSGNVSTNIGDIAPLRELGYSILMVDYRGYGESQGAFPSEKRVYEDAEDAWHYLRSRRIDPANIFIYGHSLGAAIAIELALRHPEAGGLIVESAFTSIPDMAKLRPQYALLPTRLLNQQFDSIDKVSRLRLPVLYIHGTADEVVPYRMGQELFRASGGRKRFVAVGGGLHDNNAAVGGPLFRGEIRDFVEGERDSL
jgi:pimeloyl-ACP methyl ester carboxylesterase